MADTQNRTNWGMIALYGAAAGGVLLFSYGIYNLITSFGPGPAIGDCESNWQDAFAAYNTQYQAYSTQNGGAPLTEQQEQSLQQYVTTMNDAEQCIVSVQNASTQALETTLTTLALAAIATAGLAYAFRAWLQNRGGSAGSGAELRAASRNSYTQAQYDSGAQDADQAAANVDATNDAVSGEATSEVDALSGTTDDLLASAESVGNETLVEQIQTFVADVIEQITYYVEVVYDYFSVLF